MNNSPDFSATPKPKPLSFTTKLAYGAGDLGPAITANILAFFLLFFFTNVAGLNPGIAGSILMIGKIWDAVNDPLVGVLSDRTQSRIGRRLPWMIWGAIPFGAFYVLQWIVPRFSDNPAVNQWWLFGYYVLVAILFNTAYTAVNLPYTALTPELTQDYNERTSLNSFRFLFSIGGSILSLILAQVIFALLKPTNVQSVGSNCNAGVQQYVVLALVCSLLAIVSIYWCVWGIRDRVLASERHRLETTIEAEIPLKQQIQIALSNRPFLYVIGIYFCSWLAVQVTASIIPYFVVNVMGREDQFIPVLLAVQGTALVMLFVWTEVSKQLGKKAVYFLGMGLWIIAQAGLYFLQPQQIGLMYLLAVMAGFGVSTAYLIPWSMVPDVVELDELQTGQRREGIFYSFMVLLQKMGLALGLFILGHGLALAGFKEQVPCQPPPEQGPAALYAIRLAIGPLPTLALILGLILAYYYPITREIHAETLLQLEERRRSQNQHPPEP